MSRFAPLGILVLVTGLFLGYGRFSWSWVAGPIAALFVWALAQKAAEPGSPAPKHTARRQHDPAPVD